MLMLHPSRTLPAAGPATGPAASHPPAEALHALRAEIEAVDHRLVECIAERLRLARLVGACKREAGLPVRDVARETVVVHQAARLARELAVPEAEVRAVFWELVTLCRREQGEPQ